MTTLRFHRFALAGLLLICAFAAVGKLTYIGTTPNSDYESYLATAQHFSDIPATVYPQRVLKPLAPLGVAAVAPFIGFSAAFLFEVVLFYFAFALALYWLAYLYFKNRRLAFFAALLGALSYPLLRYGLDLYTETGALFFYVLSLALTLIYIQTPSRRILCINALVIGIGLIWKEYSVVAGLVFGLTLLFENATVRAKVQNLFLLGLISLTPTALVQLWVFLAYHYTYFNWYLAGGASGFKTEFTLHNFAKSFAALLGLGWLLVPVGAVYFFELSPSQKRFLQVAIPASLIALVWGYVSSRLFYVMAPAFILLAVYGLSRLPKWAQVCAVVVIVGGNIAWLILAASGVTI